jgi:SnoaL-like domain
MTSDITAIADRLAITDQIYRYCRAMDRIDHALGYRVWHDDGIADYGPDVFQGSGRDFIDFVCRQHANTLCHSHQMSNIIIELDGDRAGSESYVTATLRIMRGEQLSQISVWSRYIDTWSKRDSRWAIDKRIAIRDFSEIRDVTAMGADVIGRRDRDDPSYGVLRGV